jgi:hypothetical protein
VVSEETAHTDTKRLLQTLKVQNRLQAVLKGRRCGMVQIRAAPLLTINPRSTHVPGWGQPFQARCSKLAEIPARKAIV